MSLARALVTEPAIVLADEPTGNLDSRTGKGIMTLLRRSCDELNQAIITVTHDPRAAAYADRVVFLRDGRIERTLEHDPSDPLPERLAVIMAAMEDLEV